METPTMTHVSMFTSPMARKKVVNNKYSPSTFRVISRDAEMTKRTTDQDSFFNLPNNNIIGQDALKHPSNDYRHNRPNPKRVNFLRHNAHMLNEPVCDVYTDESQYEQNNWWHLDRHPGPYWKTPYSRDSTQRHDYQYHYHLVPKGHGRMDSSCNEPARGGVPNNHLAEPDGKPRLWKENISYEHMYDSRSSVNYPERSKRHGAFVYTRHTDDFDVVSRKYNLKFKSNPPWQTVPADLQQPKNSQNKVSAQNSAQSDSRRNTSKAADSNKDPEFTASLNDVHSRTSFPAINGKLHISPASSPI